jgi:hypothetical protein
MIDVLISTIPAGETLAEEDVVAVKRRLFHAILDEERDRLKTIPDQIATIESEIGPST